MIKFSRTDPVTVVDDDCIGVGKVDSETTSSCTQQEQKHVIIAETTNLQQHKCNVTKLRHTVLHITHMLHTLYRYNAGCSGLVVAFVTAVREVLGSNCAVGSCVYRTNHCDLQPWARAVHTLPAVPRSA